MGSRSPETQIKRARELALKEKRERKQAKKDSRAAEKLRALEEGPLDGEGSDGELVEGSEGVDEEQVAETVSLETD